MTTKEAIEWLRAQQSIFDASGNKKDRRPEQAAALIKRLQKELKEAKRDAKLLFT